MSVTRKKDHGRKTWGEMARSSHWVLEEGWTCRKETMSSALLLSIQVLGCQFWTPTICQEEEPLAKFCSWKCLPHLTYQSSSLHAYMIWLMFNYFSTFAKDLTFSFVKYLWLFFDSVTLLCFERRLWPPFQRRCVQDSVFSNCLLMSQGGGPLPTTPHSSIS